MALRAAARTVIVTPSGDNTQTEHGRLIIVNGEADTTVYRGVVEHVGLGIDEDIEPGNVLHYCCFIALAEKHVVSSQHIVAYED